LFVLQDALHARIIYIAGGELDARGMRNRSRGMGLS
jgi:hypothetical protein